MNANIAGVLITQVDIDKIVSYGGDYYYQGYYDYYGYNAKGEDAKNKLNLSADKIAEIRQADDQIQYDFGLAQTAGNSHSLDDSLEFHNGEDRTVHNDVPSGMNGLNGDFQHGYTDSPHVADSTTDVQRSRSSSTAKDRFVDDLDLI